MRQGFRQPHFIAAQGQLRHRILRFDQTHDLVALERLAAQAVVIGRKTGTGDKGLNTALLSAVARHFGAVFEFVFIHPRQRVVPPLARGAVTAGMGAPAERYARTAAGADDHGKHGLGTGRRAVDGLRDRQAVGVVGQTHFPLQARA